MSLNVALRVDDRAHTKKKMKDKINQTVLEDGKATEKLLRLIPVEDIRIVLDAYHGLSKVTKRLRLVLQYPHKDLNDIKHSLNHMMRTVGWITKDERDALLWELIVKTGKGKKGVSRSNLEIRNRVRKNKVGAPKNYALEILCFSLTYLLRKKTGRPHYDLVTGFLHEQDIMNRGFSQGYLKKRRNNLDLSAIEFLLYELGGINEDSEPVINHDYGKYDDLLECLWRYEGKKEEKARRHAEWIHFQKTRKTRFPLLALAEDNRSTITDYDPATGDITP